LIGAGNASATPGTLSVGALTLNGGGGYTWDLSNTSGTPGTNWDLITATSTTIGATSGDKFTIFLTGNPTNWSPASTYSAGWNILQWGTLSAFDANAFAVSTVNFTGTSPTGTWAFQNSGGFLNLSYTAPSGTAVWTAGGGNWSVASNWQANAVPSNNTPLEFSGAGGESTNNSALTTISGLTFTANASGSYTLNGTALSNSGGISNLSNRTQTVAMDTTMTVAQSVSAHAGNLTLTGAVDNGGFLLTASGNNTILIQGALSGAGGLTKSGNNTLSLAGNNSYSGTTTVSAGNLSISHNTALGSTAGGTTVASGAALQLSGGITVAGEALTINGTGIGNTGALVNTSGNNEWTGNISTGSAPRIGATAGNLTISGNISIATSGALDLRAVANTGIILSGVISGSGAAVGPDAGHAGTLTLSGNNTYTGNTLIESGTVSINSIKNSGVSSAVGAGSELRLASNAATVALVYTGNGDTSNRTITLSGGGQVNTKSTIIFNHSGAGTLSFTGNVGNSNLSRRDLILQGSTTGIGEFAGPILAGGNETLFTTLTKNGTGTWILSGANTYTGTTTINTGTLQIGNGSTTGSLNASSAITNNATLVFNRSNTITQGTNFASAISGTGALIQAGSGNLVLSGANTYSGATTVASGTLK
ncbi:MAG: beta strand repeat-containing protein, partial [Spartobacteria bacterium]